MITLLLALGLGIGVGVADIVLDTISSRLIVTDQPGLSEPPWFLGLMGSIGAGIVEETCFRLGVMSTVVWLLAKLLEKNKASPAVIWSVIILAGVLFGAAHIPRLMGLVPDATKLMMLLVVLGNLINGAAFGWLFWRKGLIAAITAHIAQDILTHVLLPLLA
jgi:membrane protease YdiL (CAAX protease family)